MDITTICKFIIWIGILQKSSPYDVDRILFEAHEKVNWSDADGICQKNNGKLFKPNETSFDVPIFNECNFNHDLWVAATYINFLKSVSDSRSDSVIKCEMCKIEENCGITCLYKSCENRCNAICESQHGPLTHFWSDGPNTWTEASKWCQNHFSQYGDKVQNASSLFHHGVCSNGCFWTKNVILVKFETNIAPTKEQGECGILHNGTLTFASCNIQLHPLCERVAKTDLETPRPYFSEGNISCALMNTEITSMTTTQGSRGNNQINATINTTSTYGALSVANDIAKRTTIGLKDNSPLLVPVGETAYKNHPEDSSHKSDTGIIIGAAIGSIVFLMMTVLVIICFRRKLLQRTGKRKSKYDSKNMKMQKTDTINNPIYPYECQDVPLETGSGLTQNAQLESKCEESCSSIFGQISNPGKSASMLDPEESNFNYATVTKKVNVNSSNSNSNIDYDSYDHLNGIQEGRDNNVAGNVYDTANFEQRNGCIIKPDSIYSISGEHVKPINESVGLYDRVNTATSDEYDTTYDLRTAENSTYDHI